MAQYNMSFDSFTEMMTFFKKKHCPNCESKELIRHFYKKYIGRKGKGYSDSLGQNNYYNTTAVYTCNECGKSYTLKGLISNEPLDESNELLTEGESQQVIKQRDRQVTEMNKNTVVKIFTFVIIFMLAIIAYAGISSGDSSILLVFGPIILFFALVSFFIVKFFGNK